MFRIVLSGNSDCVPNFIHICHSEEIRVPNAVSNMWLWTPWDAEPGITLLAMDTNNLPIKVNNHQRMCPELNVKRIATI
jgi:hypothetical protein